MKFRYDALNNNRQKLSGVISGEDQEEARRKLHGMGLTVLSLEEDPNATETPMPMDGVTTFYFRVRDKKGKEVTGTIDAPDRKAAFLRLLQEYDFDILSLCETTVPEADRDAKGREGLDALKRSIEEESDGEITFADKPSEAEADIPKVDNRILEQKKEITKNVEEIVGNAKEVLEQFKEVIENEEYRAIQDQIDHLMRMRLSNNIKYIQDLADELLVLLDDVLQKYSHEEEGESASASSPEMQGDDTLYQEGVEKHGEARGIKHISQRMGSMMKKYKKKKLRKKRVQKNVHQSELGKRFSLFFSSITTFFSHLFRALSTKNAHVRRRYFKSSREALGRIGALFAPSKKLNKIHEEAERAAPAQEVISEENEELQSSAPQGFQHFFFRFFEEAHLFMGFVLAFYIGYFFLAGLGYTRFGDAMPLFSFVERTLETKFLFLVTGIFFLLFLGLTLIVRLSYRSVLLGTTYFLLTLFVVALYYVNFPYL